jgi:predicted alpha/beta hydrolase family esterase
MTTLVATNGIPVKGIDLDRFSIVTIFGAATQRPAWQTMFGWPVDGAQAVPLDVRSAADRTRWAARLDDAVRGADRAVLLVADGLGCAASAWWARLSPADYVARIAGAILLAPGSGDRDALFDSPQTRLPFPSLVIQSGDAAIGPAAEDWGSHLVVNGRDRQREDRPVAWRQAQQLFLRLTGHVVEQDVNRARARIARL